MLNQHDYDANHARHAEHLRFAEEHNAQLAMLDEAELPMYAVVLTKVGEMMVEVGETLQTRYGNSLSMEPHHARSNS